MLAGVLRIPMLAGIRRIGRKRRAANVRGGCSGRSPTGRRRFDRIGGYPPAPDPSGNTIT